jgi:hypothetical protein
MEFLLVPAVNLMHDALSHVLAGFLGTAFGV